MKTFNVIEYLKKEPFNMDEFLVMIGRAELLLSREEEKTLVIKAHQGDDEAMNRLLWANAHFVINLASQFRGKGARVQELLKVGMLALRNAVMEYDINTEESLIKFAVPQMRKALEKFKKKV